MARQERGFTLLELMMVVTIIAILAAIAIPSYSDYVTRGRVVEATAGLGDGRNKMEQYFQDNRAYPSACVVSPTAPGATQVQFQALQRFTLSCVVTATTYTITATGSGPMAGFTYTIDQNNVRTSAFSGSGASTNWTAASPNTCWVIRKGGLCS
ncbi:MAG TPA: type IV pilin protein [Usitatibacter sp.]